MWEYPQPKSESSYETTVNTGLQSEKPKPKTALPEKRNLEIEKPKPILETQKPKPGKP